MTDLSAVDETVLVVLMAEGRAVTRKDLAHLGPAITTARAVKLARAGLVDVERVGRADVFTLTEKGWGACEKLLDRTVRVPGQPAYSAVFTLLRSVGRSMAAHNATMAETFAPVADDPPVDDSVPEAVPISVGSSAQAAIVQAYRELRERSDAWVSLADLRNHLTLSRTEIDEALTEMALARKIVLNPEENRKSLTEAQRAAAIRLGGEQKHLLLVKNP